MDAYLRKQGDLDLKYEGKRIDFETIGFRIAVLETALAKNNRSSSQLQAARNELNSMLAKFTEANPLVREQRARIQALEQQPPSPTPQAENFQSGEGGVSERLFMEIIQLQSAQGELGEQVKKLDEVRKSLTKQLSAMPEKHMHAAQIQTRKQARETARALLDSRLREAELFSQNTLGYYRILAPAEPGEIVTIPRLKKVLLLSLLSFFGGLGTSLLWTSFRGAFNGRVTTPSDLRRASKLDVITTLPDGLQTPQELENWAFRAWTTLRVPFGITQEGGIVGILSREPVIATQWIVHFAEAVKQRGQKAIAIGCFAPGGVTLTEALANPAWVVQSLAEKAALYLTIEEDFRWNSDLRSQWKAASQIWLEQARATVLLEISPASDSESVLLGELLPAILLLTQSGHSKDAEIAGLVQSYSEAGCAFKGAALSHSPSLRPSWLTQKFALGFALFAFLLPLHSLPAAEPQPPRAQPVKPAWLEKFVLGPGDGFDISVYGHPELVRNDVSISADGRINYLQAQGIMAAGLTVDELRERLNAEISRYYQHAQVILSPVAFKSKRIFILGKVVNKGAIILDRPLTILEAVAEAGGLETGLYQQNTVELADLPRSLLVRKGKRVPLNFEKLFFEGDLSQNLALEPDDYVFFPSSSSNQFYVLGAVRTPSTQGITNETTVVSALSKAGGMLDSAWRKKALVVRGSLSTPQTFVINVEDVLAGRAQDFRLEPNDILYIADRPWIRVEQLLATVVNTFTQAAVASWTGANVGPFITRPLLPQR